MRRPPRRPTLGIITRQMWRGVGVVAAVMAIGPLGVLDLALRGGLIPGGLIPGDGTDCRRRRFQRAGGA